MSTLEEQHTETIADIEETYGTVPGFLESLPQQDLVNEWPILKRFQFGEGRIDPKTREFVGLAVAAAIGCEYCRHFHRGAAQLHGATEAELAEVAFLASYTPRYSALIQAQDYDLETFYDEFEQIADHLAAQATADD